MINEPTPGSDDSTDFVPSTPDLKEKEEKTIVLRPDAEEIADYLVSSEDYTDGIILSEIKNYRFGGGPVGEGDVALMAMPLEDLRDIVRDYYDATDKARDTVRVSAVAESDLASEDQVSRYQQKLGTLMDGLRDTIGYRVLGTKKGEKI